MNTLTVPLSLSLATGLIAAAPSHAALASLKDLRVVEHRPHETLWEYTVSSTDLAGEITVGYTELATGLNWFNPESQTYERSVPEFRILPEGYAVAARGQHKVLLAGNINQGGSVDLEFPDGSRMLSNPMGLSYRDAATERSVLLAEVKDCEGLFFEPNVILFPDAFDGIKAGLRYTYTRAGLEQDVILYAHPGNRPEFYGLDPATTALEMFTEVFVSPQPEVRWRTELDGSAELAEPVPPGAGKDGVREAKDLPKVVVDPDPVLVFGSMRMGRGRAYFLNQDLDSAAIQKSWEVLDGRQFLIESIPYEDIVPLLDKLAAAPAPGAENLARGTVHGRGGIAASMPIRGAGTQLAGIAPSSSPQEPGVVLDYSLTGYQTNYTFRSDATYLVTGATYLYGTTTMEGGAVVKFTNSVSPTLQYGPHLSIGDHLDWQATKYRPAVFTAKDDNSVGATISGSSGSPSGHYAYCALRIYGISNRVDLQHFRISHSLWGMTLYGPQNHRVRHGQIADCATAVYADNSDLQLQNLLVQRVTNNFFYAYAGATASAQHITLDDVTRVSAQANVVALTNSLLVNVTDWSCAFAGSNNGTNSTGVFASAAAGDHYLAAGSVYRDAGYPDIDPALARDLAQLTTYPPIMLSGAITTPTTLAPVVPRDSDGYLDLGYHYAPLDYVASNVLVQASLVLTNGVAIGTDGSYGLGIGTTNAIRGEGSATLPNRIVHIQNVQEAPRTWGHGGHFRQMDGYPSDLSLRFTELCGMPGRTSSVFDGASADPPFSALSWRDCVLRGMSASLYPASTSEVVLAWTNNVIERCTLNLGKGYASLDAPLAVHLFNNLFRGGSLTLYYYNGANKRNWDIRDNLFDGASLTPYIDGSATGYVAKGWNAFTVGTADYLGGTSNISGIAAEFERGPLGRFYYPATGGTNTLAALVDAGSRSATNAGLYHYTTTVAHGREGHSTVDIGHHYAATEPTEGLVAHWKGDEGSGTVVGDSSSYGHTGTLTAATWTNGPMNGALHFDGYTDNVSAEESAALRLPWEKTISLWFRKNAETPTHYLRILGKGVSTDRNYFVSEAPNTTEILFQQRLANGDWWNMWTTSGTSTGQWYHLAAVIDGPTATLYLDGNVEATKPMYYEAATSGEPVTLGGRPGYAWETFNGALDDVRIYRRALSAGEVAGLSNLVDWAYDSDGDGIPDYLEDRNGNGSADSGETDWQQSENGTTGVPGLQVFPPLE